MKPFLALLLILLVLASALSGCAPGPNQFQGTAKEGGGVAGFWLGLWQGFVAVFVFVASLFMHNLNVYEIHNNGAWYNLGYLLGLACFFGGGGSGAAKRRKGPQ